jgi:L-ascorbate metabolism protein UlaG (beta-lactamase superfamily)
MRRGSLSARPHGDPVSDHFDGKRFFNQVYQKRGVTEFLKWQFTRRPAAWPERIGSGPGAPPPRRVGPGELYVTFVGHATVLVQTDGVNVLADPQWSERASPVSWAGPKRVRQPGLRFDDLPPIDAVLVSHNHYDHMDLPTLVRLAGAHRPRVVAPLGNRVRLEGAGIAGVEELDWWDGVEIAPRVRVVLVPTQHFSGRTPFDRNAALWGGFVVQGPAGTVYVAGDTGYGPHFAQIRERFAPIRLAVLPIGAYEPRWFMAYAHLDPEDAVRAHQVLGAQTSLGVHFGTFQLTDEPVDEPVERLHAALKAAGIPQSRFWVLGFGEGRAVPPSEGTVPSSEGTGGVTASADGVESLL